ncbi:ribonuclease P protein subunit p40-like isoform X2 [Trichogramma pretiosum]|uniref:ribonuclease P protein subunit p40-like isoform X2 n=1 Tax=Trichogramma pretiosum TaxID=7493 RepID=UPI000C71B2CE|nr:ribonuclease P protein subunit p40-like isoform X2 [Trichogramma pretiosum]
MEFSLSLNTVSLFHPRAMSYPDSNFVGDLLQNTGYWKVKRLSLAELIDKEFIAKFVKEGEVTLLSVGARIDTDDVVAVTPSGFLVLNLLRSTYQASGLEGKPSYFERSKKEATRFVVTIDLNDEKLTPGKKYYDRVHRALSKLEFDVLLAWDPLDPMVSHLSIMLWLVRRKYKARHIEQTVRQKKLTDLDVPAIGDETVSPAFFEWLGMISIGGVLESHDTDGEYLSSYSCPVPSTRADCLYLQIRGFLTRKRMERIFKLHQEFYAAERAKIGADNSWFAADVQGFADSPVSWALNEHSFYVDGDNSYTVVSAGDKFFTRKSWSSNSMPKIKQ